VAGARRRQPQLEETALVKLKKITALMVASLTLTAFGALAPPTPSEGDQLATRVSGTLTALPPAIPLPTEIPPTSPGPSLTPSPEPTQAPPTATFTAEPTSTPSSSPTPLASATLLSGDPKAQLGNPSWRDPFNSGGNWPLGEDQFTRAEVEDGRLVMTGLTTTDGWRLSWPRVQDFYIEMTVETEDCSGSDHYGLIVRVPDLDEANQGYLFGFTCDGRYSLRAWDGETMTSLIRATSSSAVQAGSDKTNRMGLLADGDRLTLYANGVKLAEIEDDTFDEEGNFGIFVGSRQSDDFTIRVDEIAYWENP
jgi:hypothetical protein